MTAMVVFLSRAVALAAMAFALLLPATAQAEARAETRCGWFVNPTPGNFWLTDADADWWLAAQGGLAVGGWETVDWSKAKFEGDAWVPTHPNGEYGYGCACIGGDFGRAAAGEVWFIDTIRALPLRKCLTDPALPPPPR